MFYTKNLLTTFAFFVALNLYSQNSFEGLGETAFAINHKVSSNYKINFSARSRYFLFQDDHVNFENRQLDFVHFSTLNLDYNHSLSLGIQYRLRESIDGGSNELRITQQFSYTKKMRAIRFGHRTRFEQRILNNFTIFRTRYRFALDLPLNGEKLDIGEGYLVTSTELLLSLTHTMKPEIDHRTNTQIGWLLSKKSKVQLGLEYRFEAFNIKTENKLYFLTSYILKV